MLAPKPPREREIEYCKKERRPNTDDDFFLFDGASSEQNAGEFLEHRAASSTKVRCDMHLDHSFFDRVAKIPLAAELIEDHTPRYSWFSATHRQNPVAGVQQGQARRGH